MLSTLWSSGMIFLQGSGPTYLGAGLYSYGSRWLLELNQQMKGEQSRVFWSLKRTLKMPHKTSTNAIWTKINHMVSLSWNRDWAYIFFLYFKQQYRFLFTKGGENEYWKTNISLCHTSHFCPSPFLLLEVKKYIF